MWMFFLFMFLLKEVCSIFGIVMFCIPSASHDSSTTGKNQQAHGVAVKIPMKLRQLLCRVPQKGIIILTPPTWLTMTNAALVDGPSEGRRSEPWGHDASAATLHVKKLLEGLLQGTWGGYLGVFWVYVVQSRPISPPPPTVVWYPPGPPCGWGRWGSGFRVFWWFSFFFFWGGGGTVDTATRNLFRGVYRGIRLRLPSRSPSFCLFIILCSVRVRDAGVESSMSVGVLTGPGNYFGQLL